MSNSTISALGLDIGRKRIGVAGCDKLGLMATELTTIHRTSFAKDIEQLQNWVQEREAEVLVVGMPYSMNGSVGSQAKQVQRFAQRVAGALNMPLEFVDERLTSHEAKEQLKAQKVSLRNTRHQGLIDRKAAAIILQQWLEQRRQGQPPPGNPQEVTKIP